MPRGVRPILAAAALCLALAGCAAVPISPEVLGQVNKQIGMAELGRDPNAYIGEVVLLGGRIIQTEVRDGATEITVLQNPLDRSARPQGGDVTQGRFLARLAAYADPAVYAPGRLITVAGRVAGSELRPLGQIEYRYPVLEALEAYLWQGRQRDGYPNVFFSIGVGTFF